MNILVIGSPKRDALIGFDNVVLGLCRAGYEFDHYPNILTESYGQTGTYQLRFDDAKGIRYPGYKTVVENLKRGVYDFIITTVCRADYRGGRHGVFSTISRRVRYSLESSKFKMGGTLVADWIRQGMKLPPFAVVDDLDEPFIHPVDYGLLLHSAVYFKRELPFNRFLAFRLFKFHLTNRELMDLAVKLRPTWISYDMSSLAQFTDTGDVWPYDRRDIDITFLGSTYASYTRQLMLPHLERLAARYRTVTPESGRKPKAEFYDVLKRSRINISPDGRGWDAPKHYEMLLAGSLVFIMRPTIELAYDLKDGVNCVMMDYDFRNIEERADYYLSRPDLSAEIAKRGRELALRSLGNTSLARHIIDTASEAIGRR